MASTPSNRLKLTPSNSPFVHRTSRSPVRARHGFDSRLSLKRVIGTTCSSPLGFDTSQSAFAYIAGGAVVVVDVHQDKYSQRFFRARPTAVPTYNTSPVPHTPSTPTATPKANDSRNRVAPSLRESPYSPAEWSIESPSSKTWTSRERIKAATCLSLSPCGKFLAAGETGYAPRVLIFGLQDNSSDTPLVAISEHAFGVRAVAWSPDSRYLASLGAANDGCLYLWRIDPRTGAAKLHQQNRCTSSIRGMIWMGSSLVTLGVRHVKVWKPQEEYATSPTKPKMGADGSFAPLLSQKPLAGRNVLLKRLIDATFLCAAAIDDKHAVVCSEAGDVCLLEDDGKEVKLHPVVGVGFPITAVAIRDRTVHVGARDDRYASLAVENILNGGTELLHQGQPSSIGVLAMDYLGDRLVTIDADRSIQIWGANAAPWTSQERKASISIPGHGEAILGIHSMPQPNSFSAAFYTWSASGRVDMWDLDGRVAFSIAIPIERGPSTDTDMNNQLSAVKVAAGGKLIFAGDRFGILRAVDSSTGQCTLETKAHTSDCQVISVFEKDSRLLVASCGRDRTTQLFQRTSSGSLEHVQTLEFAARVVQVLIPSDDKLLTCSLDRTLQVHEMLTKESEPDAIAAMTTRVIPLKASPSSMVLSPDEKHVFVSLLDRSICQFDIATGQASSSFKCTDERGVESVVLDSLVYEETQAGEPNLLLGISNTDKSVRIYDAQAGSFLDREWGHTEAINGSALLSEEGSERRIVSVGSDGTIMIWGLDLQPPATSTSRDPSPAKEGAGSAHRTPLRRVLSKAELAEFQRPPPAMGRSSPPRQVQRRASRYGLSRMSTAPQLQTSPAPAIAEDTSSRRASSGSPSTTPPSTVSLRRVTRRPSLPALSSTGSTPTGGLAARKKTSAVNLRSSYAYGTLNLATESACRTLRAYRTRLESSESISQDVLAELDVELRLTQAAVGDRAIRSRNKALSETVLSGLLDQYSERLVTMLDLKLRLRGSDGKDGADDALPSPGEEPEKKTLDGNAEQKDGGEASATTTNTSSSTSTSPITEEPTPGSAPESRSS